MIHSILNIIFLILVLAVLYQSKRRHLPLGHRVLLSLILGIGYGLWLKFSSTNFSDNFIQGTLYFLGNGYLALLKMLVTPLIMTSIIHALLNLGRDDGNIIKKMSLLTCGMLLGMTALSSLISIFVGFFLNVGEGMLLPQIYSAPKHTYTGLIETLLGMLPSNPILQMSEENTIAIVLFAVLLGLAARLLDDKDHDKMTTFSQLIASLFAIVKKLATIILSLTPYGVFALIALLIFSQGLSSFSGIANFIFAMYVAMLLVFIMHFIFIALSGRNPWGYLKDAYTALFVAFTTRSSFGTLPVTEETLRNKFKTKQVTATFVPSIGATIGMNACAGVYPAMLVVMALNIQHLSLTPSLILLVMGINAIASLGISGIPGTAYIAATITLTSLNLPYAVLALVQGVDPIVDMGRTATNVNGVMTTALLVDPFTHEK